MGFHHQNDDGRGEIVFIILLTEYLLGRKGETVNITVFFHLMKKYSEYIQFPDIMYIIS